MLHFTGLIPFTRHDYRAPVHAASSQNKKLQKKRRRISSPQRATDIRELNRRPLHFFTSTLISIPALLRDFPKFSSHLFFYFFFSFLRRAGHNLYSINGAAYVTEIGAQRTSVPRMTTAAPSNQATKNKRKNGLDTCYMSLSYTTWPKLSLSPPPFSTVQLLVVE